MFRHANLILRPADLITGPATKPRKRRFTGHVHQSKASLAAMRPIPCPGGVTITVPIRIFNESNISTHYHAKGRRTKKIREAIHFALCLCRGLLPTFPCEVILVRHGPRTMDNDGNVRAFKAVRDEIAKHAGIDDAERFGWTWTYGPQVIGDYAVTLTFRGSEVAHG